MATAADKAKKELAKIKEQLQAAKQEASQAKKDAQQAKKDHDKLEKDHDKVIKERDALQAQADQNQSKKKDPKKKTDGDTSSDDDDDHSGKSTCAELRKRHMKGLPAEILKVFIYERSFCYGKNGPAWGKGPAEALQKDHRYFIFNASSQLSGSTLDAELRPRLNILMTDKIFSQITVQLIHDAELQYNELQKTSVNPPKLSVDLTDNLSFEIFTEFTAIFLHYYNHLNGQPITRPITDTVGLLREIPSNLLKMTAASFTQYVGRSIVSYFLAHNDRKQLPSIVIDRKRQRYNDPPFSTPPPIQTIDKSPSPGNRSISTNNTTRSPELWRQGDQARQGSPPTQTSRHFTVKPSAIHLRCINCGGNGHTNAKCVSGQTPDPHKKCFCCNGIGHFASRCPSDKIMH